MNQATSEEVRALRAEFPGIFSHPEARPNEIWVDEVLLDLIGYVLHDYKTHGFPSARQGIKATPHLIKAFTTRNRVCVSVELSLGFYPVFVDVSEYLRVRQAEEEARKQKMPTTAAE